MASKTFVEVVFLWFIVVSLHFDTYAFESGQRAVSCHVWFVYTNLASSHQILISSEAMRHPVRMFDTVLEHQKVILSVFESHRNIPVSLGNTWSTSVDPSVDQNMWKYEYYAYIWVRVVLKYEFLWQIFFRNSKIWIISFQTHYQPCCYDV